MLSNPQLHPIPDGHLKLSTDVGCRTSGLVDEPAGDEADSQAILLSMGDLHISRIGAATQRLLSGPSLSQTNLRTYAPTQLFG